MWRRLVTKAFYRALLIAGVSVAFAGALRHLAGRGGLVSCCMYGSDLDG